MRIRNGLILIVALVTAFVSAVVTTAPAAGAVTSGSLTWRAPLSVDPAHGGFTDVSCPSATSCLAGGRHGSVLRYTGGTTWTAMQKLGDIHTTVREIDCTSPTFCVATTVRYGVSGLRYVYDGARWTTYNASATPRFSCVDRTFCLMSQSYGPVSRWNGTSWVDAAFLPHDLSDPYQAVSCAAATLCMQLADGGRVFRYDGENWSDGATVGSADLTAIDCQTTTFCVAVDDQGRAVTYDGTSWSQPTAIDPGHSIDAVDCSSANFCVATDHVGYRVEYHDGAWAAPQATQAGVSLIAVSCPTSAFCAAVTRVGSAVLRVDGTWQPARFVNTAYGDVAAVSCGSAGFCLVADGSGAIVRYDGTRWHQPSRLVADGDPLTDIACLSTEFCMAVTEDGRAFVRSTGGTWSAPKQTGLTEADGVACTSVSFCLVTGFGTANAVVWDGTTFTARGAEPGQYLAHYRPTCARAGDCFALPYDIEPMMRYHNGVWARSNGAGDAYSIDCAGASFCMAMTFAGDSTEIEPHIATAYRWNGTTFTKASADYSQPLLNVSCGSSTFCVAAETGYEATWNGSAWSSRQTLDPRGNFNNIDAPAVHDLDCHPAICVALETTGQVIVAR